MAVISTIVSMSGEINVLHSNCKLVFKSCPKWGYTSLSLPKAFGKFATETCGQISRHLFFGAVNLSDRGCLENTTIGADWVDVSPKLCKNPTLPKTNMTNRKRTINEDVFILKPVIFQLVMPVFKGVFCSIQHFSVVFSHPSTAKTSPLGSQTTSSRDPWPWRSGLMKTHWFPLRPAIKPLFLGGTVR